MHLAHPAARGLVWTLTSILIACGADTERKDHSLKEEKAGQGTALFERLSNELTGISFANVVEENEDQNYYTYEYLYNGGGVALGDIDNDGLTDIYLTGNLVPDKLYLNEGDLRFRDITTEAITTGGDGWHSGVVMADVNGDGLLDIYVCRAGWYADPEKRRNLLYINNGDRTFREEAARWGVDDTTRSTHAAFFDMDRDGDLDLFVLNTPIQSKVQLSNRDIARLIAERRSPTDRLFRNDGDHFEDITSEAGIWNMGYGLGVAIADLDDDGWPDIHVSNDYVERDFLYMNQGDGTFRDEALNRYRHISNFGMGCDAADLNNDGLMDLIELDMVSADHVRSKKNMGSMDPDKFRNMVAAGLHHQYMINTLQLNRGDGQFSEVGQLAGVARTDWSWAPLFADLDNDGLKDLLVTNGYKRDMRDNDYMVTARAYAESG
ncbi:MAG: VCBS repeat-containing protein, partial [Flavobacteriales bacterium]|nr:VCBS repeat-containing protein [Flavobacteriales bacterium]